MDNTIIVTLSKWFLENYQGIEGAIIEPIADGIVWDMAEGFLWKPFKNKISKYFKKGNSDNGEKECLEFTKQLFELPCKNPQKPYRDIEDLYEKTTNSVTDEKTIQQLLEDLKQVIIDNKDNIEKLNQSQKMNNGIVIKKQIAKDKAVINNIQGNQTTYKVKGDLKINNK